MFGNPCFLDGITGEFLGGCVGSGRSCWLVSSSPADQDSLQRQPTVRRLKIQTISIRQGSQGAVHKVHKVRHAIFGQFLPPLSPVTLCHTSRDPPRKYVTPLGPPPDF